MDQKNGQLNIRGLTQDQLADAALAVRLAGYDDISAYLRERLLLLVELSREDHKQIFNTPRQHPAVRQVLEVLQRGSATVEEIYRVKKEKLPVVDIRFALDWLEKHGLVEKRRDFVLDGAERGRPKMRFSLK